MTPDDRTAKTRRQSFPFRPAVFDLLACLVGFAVAIWLYASLSAGAILSEWPAGFMRETAISAFTAWIAIAFTWNPWSDGVRLWIDRLFSAIGFNLMVQYGLDYFLRTPPTPWPAAILGSVLSIALLSLYRDRPDLTHPQHPGGTLLLGYDSVAESIRSALGRVVGVLSGSQKPTPLPSPPPPADFRQLGNLSRLDEVLVAERPTRLVVNDPSWSSVISPRRLLALRYAGVVVEDAPSLFENLLKRVCWERLDPLDLLLSPRLNINRPAIALQAVYTNLISLALLLLLSPVIILCVLLMGITTGAAPMDSFECLGFQRMPFRLLRFRTVRRNGDPIWSGSLLKALHLVALPQLINVVRGEMALFGPPPARKVFAERLEQLVPPYAHRFSVKPGLIGWSQANLGDRLPVTDELLRLEYDLYYIREESPSLDLDILFRTIFRLPLGPQ